jgi:hypothetical protein
VTHFNAQTIAAVHEQLEAKGARKNYDVATKRIATTITRMRKRGHTDLEIGLMIGATLTGTPTPEPTILLALACIAEIEGLT